MSTKRFYVGSDHGGVELRRHLTSALRDLGHEVTNELGPASSSESCDYPDVAVEVCQLVLRDPGSVGILVCGTGQGMAMSANKIPGIRAGVCGDVFSARMIREHNDANVVCFGQRVLGLQHAAVLLEAFVSSAFGGGRHQRRVGKIDAIGRGQQRTVG